MANRKITALPSLVICKDGNERELNSISTTEKKEIITLMSKTINNTMSDYYTEHKDEWLNIVNLISA